MKTNDEFLKLQIKIPFLAYMNTNWHFFKKIIKMKSPYWDKFRDESVIDIIYTIRPGFSLYELQTGRPSVIICVAAGAQLRADAS